MKKVYKRSIAFGVSLVMITASLPMGALAQEILDAQENENVAYVWSEDGTAGEYFTDIDKAWDTACEYGNIMLLKDWETDEVLTVDEKEKVVVYMNDFSVDRGLTEAENSGEVFLVKNKAELKIFSDDSGDVNGSSDTAKITGGYNANGGGGIHIQENASVYLYGVVVTGNKTTDGNGGGGIRLQKKNGYLEMSSKTMVTDNLAEKGNGGGISIYGQSCSVNGGIVENNTASSNGGGISVNSSGCSLSGIYVSSNNAGSGKKGGGIYMAKGCGCCVSDCIITGNKVLEGNGGGIYVDGNGGSVSYSTIRNNTAVLGGGVYIDVGDRLGLSGKVVVKDNKTTSDKAEASNLYLATNSSKAAYITGTPSEGEVHIGWDSTVRKGDIIKISESKGAYSARFLVSDVKGYYLYWSWSTKDQKNDRYLRASTTNYSNETAHDSKNVTTSNRYTVYKNGYNDKYDLQEGIYSYKATSGGDKDAVYYYSDGYFNQPPEEYNVHLATMSLAITMSAYNSAGTEFDETIHNNGYANRFRNAKLLFSDLGFKDNNIHISESFTLKPTDSSIGVIMGAKELAYDEDYILVPIVVRGAGYESEWASNVQLGESGEAKGFCEAADQVMKELESFISSDNDINLEKAIKDGKVKFWITGFSRAAATANLVAKRVTDKYGKENEIFSYCFETPKGGVDSETLNAEHTYNGQYLNIHNIINTGDIVTFVGPKEMGFKRYGVDHFVPGDVAGEITENVYTTKKGLKVTTYTDNEADEVGDDDYNARREAMLFQLALIDDSLIFDDYFSLATLNYIGYSFSDAELIGPLKNGTLTTAADWIPSFMESLLKWSANGTYSLSTKDGDGYGGDYRKFYSTNTEFSGKDYTTVEESLKYATTLIFGMDNSDEFMEAMMFRFDKLKSDKSKVGELYAGVIAMWDEQAKFMQRYYMNSIWDILTKDMTYSDGTEVPKITDFVPENEKKKLEKSTYSLMAFLLLFVCKDYDAKPSLDGVDTTQVHLGTLLYNMTNILQCHYPEVCMAWLRTYDSHYQKNDTFKYEDVEVELVNDQFALPSKIQITSDNTDEGLKIKLNTLVESDKGVDKNSKENGSAIYYQIYENDKLVSDWQLYQNPFYLDKENQAEYSIKAFCVRFQTKGSITEFNDNQIRNKDKLTGSLIGKGSVIAIILMAIIALGGGVFMFVFSKKQKKKA